MSRHAVAREILRPDAEPETRYVALMLQDAIEECRAGDAVACQWLRCRGPTWLAVLARDDDDVDWARKLNQMTEGVQLGLFA